MYIGRLARLIIKKGDGLAISGFGGRVFRHRVVGNHEEMQYSCRNRGCFIVGFLVISCLLAVSFVGILLTAIWGGQKTQNSRDDISRWIKYCFTTHLGK